MESTKDGVELIQLAINQLMEQQSAIKGSSHNDSFVAADRDEDHRRRLLASLLSQVKRNQKSYLCCLRLISPVIIRCTFFTLILGGNCLRSTFDVSYRQLEALRADGQLHQPEPSAYVEEAPPTAVGTVGRKSETMNEAEGASSGGRKVEEIVKELRNVKRQNFITHCLLSVMIVLTVAWQLSEVSLILKVKDGMSHPFRSFGKMVAGMLKGPNANNQEGEKQSSTPSMPIESSALAGLKIPELPRMEFPAFDVNNNED
ncbi:hypothetical protein RJ639_029219 [Escallonia herrerae]|uniref:Uncharacterized protein n=1 Tax=Escallonia herrerae TaxID=1293975 RepID=A0AA89BFY9_9ASTE|nr:hypothetical protein RJ639_029219 [Escallonia herrerae]